MKPVRDLLKHSTIYMIGQILTRLASVLLLPFYTSVLVPAEYGVVGILDLTAAILGTLVASGLVAAVTRYHFDEDDVRHSDAVWWTGLSMVAAICAVLCIPMWLFRHSLAVLTLGPNVPVADGAWYYTLTILTLSFTVFGMMLESYLRAMKWSVTFVAISLSRLILNIGLNVYLMVGLELGVEGLLIGNLVATVLYSVVLFCVFVKTRGSYCVNRPLAVQMVRFATPMVLAALTTMMMHEADRLFLGIWKNMEQVGVYCLAHKIGFAVNTLCLLPFLSIWNVSIYDIERMPDASRMFAKVFGWFVSALGILLLGASLTVHPVLPMLTQDAYGEAIELIAPVLGGFFVFGLSFMFQVPALLTKQTRLVIPGSIAGLTVNIGANWMLIPLYGMWGAAWAGILTYATYSFFILAQCRPVMKINYPWAQATLTVAGFVGTYVGVRFGCFPYIGEWEQLGLSVVVCAVWAAVLFGREGFDMVCKEILAKRGKAAPSRTTSTPEAATFESGESEELVSAVSCAPCSTPDTSSY